MNNQLTTIKGLVLGKAVFNYKVNRSGEGIFDNGFTAESYELSTTIRNKSDIEKMKNLLDLLGECLYSKEEQHGK